VNNFKPLNYGQFYLNHIQNAIKLIPFAYE
jgi:hypothetical protein